jgi:hypothetical protein
MPLDQLLGLESRENTRVARKITLDLRRVREHSSTGANFALLGTFTNLLCAKRRDWNGEVLSLRDSDLTILALLLTLDETATLEWLASTNLLLLPR